VSKSSRALFIGLGLAVASPGVSYAEKLPVFKLAEAQADPEHARALLAKLSAGTLSAEAKAVERSGVVGFRAGNTVVEIETASGGIFAANLDQLWNPRLTPALPARAEARQQAEAFLAENGLLPREEGYVVVSEPVYSESGVAADAPGAPKTQLDVQVNYQVNIALGNRQVPVVGGGGEFKVALGDRGAVIAYSGAWRPILGVASEEETLSQAAAEAQYRASVGGIKLTSVQASLAYYSAPSFKSQSYLAPVWVVRAMGELEGRQLPLRQAIIPATKFGPEYPVLSQKVRSSIPRRAGIDDAPRDGATSWIGPSQGLPGSPANAQGFVNGLSAHGWTINFNFGEANAWESDWNANDDVYVDAADFVFYTGHADANGWVLNMPNDTSLSWNEVGAWPGSPDDLYGQNDLEWFIVAACGPHQSTHFTTSVSNAFDRWRGTFDGLHIFMGYGAVTNDNTTEGARITELGRAGWTLIDAWFRTAWEIQPTTNGWSAPNGPTVFVTAMYAHMGDHATRNDHMHGAGTVVYPDPIGPAQQRHLLWSGT
jgi:hypothetical protein